MRAAFPGWGGDRGGGGRGAGSRGRSGDRSGRGRGRDVRGADVVAVGERRQALDVYPEQAGERVGLGLAELGELPRDVLHGAVPLAQLRTEPRYAGRGRPDRGGVAVGGQGRGQGLRARRRGLAGRLDPRPVPALELADALLGEGADGVVAERSRAGSAAQTTRGRRSRRTSRCGRGRWRRTAARGAPGRAGPAAAARRRRDRRRSGRRGDGGRRPASARAGRRARWRSAGRPRARRGRHGPACARPAPRPPAGRRLRDRRRGRHRAARSEFHTTIVSLFALPLNPPRCALTHVVHPAAALAECALHGVPICRQETTPGHPRGDQHSAGDHAKQGAACMIPAVCMIAGRFHDPDGLHDRTVCMITAKGGAGSAERREAGRGIAVVPGAAGRRPGALPTLRVCPPPRSRSPGWSSATAAAPWSTGSA